MINYLKLGIGVVLLLAFLGENFWVFRKGQASIITNVVAGSETSQKAVQTKAKDDVAQTSVDTARIAKLQRDNNDLQNHLRELAKASPRDTCKLGTDELSSLQAIARSTKP